MYPLWTEFMDGCLHCAHGVLLCFRIGRIAGRLPRDLADDVVGSVLDCFRYVDTRVELSLRTSFSGLRCYPCRDLLSSSEGEFLEKMGCQRDVQALTRLNLL